MGVGQATRFFRRAPPRPAPPATPRPQPPADHHALSIDDVVRHLQTDPQRGLSDAAIAARRRSHGRNELPQPPPVPWVLRLLKQFNSLMIWILIAAAGIALGTGEWADGGIILAIVVINGGLAFLQEDRAGRALIALQRLGTPMAVVVREGSLQSIPAADLVPGDRVELQAGDRVPADLRLIRSTHFRVDEAPLTGESTPVEKSHHPTLPTAIPLAERSNMAYMGTAVHTGQASGVVVATGRRTELGRIARLLEQQPTEPTPLERQLARLGRVLLAVVAGLVAILFALRMARHATLTDALMLSVSVAVAAVPEGLPAVVTISLAIGLTRLARRNAIIRHLPSVETLGSVTVICTDKTGTLTRNEMTVRELALTSGPCLATGVGYAPEGQFTRPTGEPVPATDPELMQALTIAATCNHAALVPADSPSHPPHTVGDPTEIALLVAAKKAHILPAAAPVVHEVPFDSDRRMMSVTLAEPAGRVLYAKGAPETLLPLCTHEQAGHRTQPLTPERRQSIARHSADMASRALRVLAVAYRPLAHDAPDAAAADRLIFAGLIGMIDPPRAEARAAVAKCHAAGIRPIMITGDHPATARAIAQELQLTPPGTEPRVHTGAELDAFDERQITDACAHAGVFARVTAEHKLRIVNQLKGQGHIVAMTGDGVNDAPAIKAADIGIAMGRTGADVTRAASDMVLSDDNFASIVAAVEEGRGIYHNIRQIVHYLLASNASELLVMLIGVGVGWPPPLLAIQILWINLVTDGLPALALATEPPDPALMTRPPRPRQQPMLTPALALRIARQGVVLTVLALLMFHFTYHGDPAQVDAARTRLFATLCFSQLFFALACRSDHATLRELGILSNKALLGAVAAGCAAQAGLMLLPATRHLFRLTLLSPFEWAIILLASVIPVLWIELTKPGRPRQASPTAIAGGHDEALDRV